jgi:hypothetical protein
MTNISFNISSNLLRNWALSWGGSAAVPFANGKERNGGDKIGAGPTISTQKKNCHT